METEEPEGPTCPMVLLSQAQHGGRCMSAQALNSLNDLRQKNLLCDATIRLEDGGVFHVHRAILSSCSTYFRYLSRSSLMRKIVLAEPSSCIGRLNLFASLLSDL